MDDRTALQRTDCRTCGHGYDAHGDGRESAPCLQSPCDCADYYPMPIAPPAKDELKRRIRLAREVFNGTRFVCDEDGAVETRDDGLADLLDLRKPLPRGHR